MVAYIIEFSARNRFIVFLLLFGLASAGFWAMKQTPIDAVPDLSDTQVIIYTKWPGRSPDLVEDQITYPIVTALLSARRKETAVLAPKGFGRASKRNAPPLTGESSTSTGESGPASSATEATLTWMAWVMHGRFSVLIVSVVLW